MEALSSTKTEPEFLITFKLLFFFYFKNANLLKFMKTVHYIIVQYVLILDTDINWAIK